MRVLILAFSAACLFSTPGVAQSGPERRVIANAAELLRKAVIAPSGVLQVYGADRAAFVRDGKPSALIAQVQDCVFELRDTRRIGYRIDFTKMSDAYSATCGLAGCQLIIAGRGRGACLLFGAKADECSDDARIPTVRGEISELVAGLVYIQSNGCPAYAEPPPRPRY